MSVTKTDIETDTYLRGISLELGGNKLGETTVSPETETTCMICKYCDEKVIGNPVTEELVERARSVNGQYSHTLGQNCVVRKRIVDHDRVDLDEAIRYYNSRRQIRKTVRIGDVKGGPRPPAD